MTNGQMGTYIFGDIWGRTFFVNFSGLYREKNRLTSQTTTENNILSSTTDYTYDNNGNTLTAHTYTSPQDTGTTKTYGYDDFNRLLTYSEGSGTTEYTYYADNLLSSKMSGNTGTLYFWNGQNLVMDYVWNANTNTNIYTYDPTGIYAANMGTSRYVYSKDPHGSVTGVVDSSGAYIAQGEYTAFGERLDTNTDLTPFGYCGEYLDDETGLIYLRNRYYDPSLGIFISEDPARDELNWYVYCYNNPIMLFDPFGLAPTAMEAAEIAAHIYDYDTSYLKEKRTIAGWRLIDVWNGREGMKMGIYIRDTDDWQNPSEYTIAFKGTTWYDLGDWQNNAEQLLSPKSADMWDAINYSKGFVNDHSQEITFVGHSKGGAEAASAAVATNKNAMIFNPATSNFSAYGLSSSGYTASMTAYIVKGDIVNHLEGWFSTPIDKAVYLPQQYGGHWYEAWQTSLYQRIQNHLMGAVKSALKEAGY